jgi:hypothetical protein
MISFDESVRKTGAAPLGGAAYHKRSTRRGDIPFRVRAIRANGHVSGNLIFVIECTE